MLNNFGLLDWTIVFLIMVLVMGAVSIKGVEHYKEDEDLKIW